MSLSGCGGGLPAPLARETEGVVTHSLQFDPASHRYAVDGAWVPSVTQTLQAVGLASDFAHVPAEVLERKRAIGEAVHTACHYDDEGDLDEATVHPDVRPYLEGWRLFRREMGFVPLLLETRVYHPLYRYAGTLDRFGRLEHQSGVYVLVDIKTGDPEAAAAALQTAAYVEALRLARAHPVLAALPDDVAVERWSVQLRPDGTYRVRVYPVREHYRDFGVFCAALQVVWYRAANGGMVR